MPKIAYIHKRFSSDSQAIIESAEDICLQYEAQGYTLTLRQLYYQFVSRNLLVNSEQSYKRLGSIINDARLAGYLDWRHIEDRTRNLRDLSHWGTPQDIIYSAADGYRTDKWATQPYRIEVWVEKDALIGVLDVVCSRNDVPYFSCRGYASQSEVWGASQRMKEHQIGDQHTAVIYLGDHDPSGLDMSRDIQDRLDLFVGGVIVERIALNMDQVTQYNLPPNPAKLTDSRFQGYLEKYGQESWELDALEPTVLDARIQETIDSFRDDTLWEEAVEKEEQEKESLMKVYRRWSDVVKYMQEDDTP